MKKTKRIPKTPLALYVQMFIKRKKSDHNLKVNNLMIEATKSWTRLSKTEKQGFQELHKECSNKYKKKFADYLKESEPFMIDRNVKRDQGLIDQIQNLVEVEEEFTQGEEDSFNNENIQNIVDHSLDNSKDQGLIDQIQNLVEVEEEFTQVEEDSFNNENIQNIVGHSLDDSNDMQCEEVTSEKFRNCSHIENIKEKPSEPAPPSVKSAKDLFEIIRDKKELNVSEWNTLTKTEKRKFQNAVLSLKKNYINNYVKYLESLESRELFQHYIDNL